VHWKSTFCAKHKFQQPRTAPGWSNCAFVLPGSGRAEPESREGELIFAYG
jgi:hypothetical protein